MFRSTLLGRSVRSHLDLGESLLLTSDLPLSLVVSGEGHLHTFSVRGHDATATKAGSAARRMRTRSIGPALGRQRVRGQALSTLERWGTACSECAAQSRASRSVCFRSGRCLVEAVIEIVGDVRARLTPRLLSSLVWVLPHNTAIGCQTSRARRSRLATLPRRRSQAAAETARPEAPAPA